MREEERVVTRIDRKIHIVEDVEIQEEANAGDKKFAGEAFQEQQVGNGPRALQRPVKRELSEQGLSEEMKKATLGGEELSMESIAFVAPTLSSVPFSQVKKGGSPKFDVLHGLDELWPTELVKRVEEGAQQDVTPVIEHTNIQTALSLRHLKIAGVSSCQQIFSAT